MPTEPTPQPRPHPTPTPRPKVNCDKVKSTADAIVKAHPGDPDALLIAEFLYAELGCGQYTPPQ